MDRSEALAVGVASVLLGLAVWIGVSDPPVTEGQASPVGVTESPERAEARLRARVKAAEARVESLEASVAARGERLAEIEVAAGALAPSEGD